MLDLPLVDLADCMLQNGAKLLSIDVGRGQLDWKLRQDPRVVCMEKTNIRYVTPEDLENLLIFRRLMFRLSLSQKCLVQSERI